LTKLLAKADLNRLEADWAMTEIMSGESSEAQVGAFMLALRAKGETVEELAGLVDVMLRHCVLLETGNDAVDIVGTGGDLAGTVNISSMAAILAAAAGVPVMKHGSRSASGKTGSSEMLEVLGLRLDLTPERITAIFAEVGITFFFAPVFHPAMRHVAPIRKQLGVPTTFNFLGPLANPAQPNSHLTGRGKCGDSSDHGLRTGPSRPFCPGFQGFRRSRRANHDRYQPDLAGFWGSGHRKHPKSGVAGA
jgi:anthranilate phosphoribosyltransferase